VLANSDYTAGLLRELSVGRVDILPGGVDAHRFHPVRDTRGELGLPRDKHLLLTACRLVPKKGLDLLMRAVAKLPHTHLLIAGDGRQLPKCKALAEQLGINARVTFAGRIPHDDLRRYYWAADQFVLCEAHAAGVPVIASRSGCIPSIVDHGRNGLLFEEDDLDGLMHSIERLRKDRELSRHLVHEGFRDAAEKWDWTVICRSHEDVFRAAAVAAGSALQIVPEIGA